MKPSMIGIHLVLSFVLKNVFELVPLWEGPKILLLILSALKPII